MNVKADTHLTGTLSIHLEGHLVHQLATHNSEIKFGLELSFLTRICKLAGRAYQNRKVSMAKTSDKKAKVYSKYGREIYMSAKSGGLDPAGNLTLRGLIEKAKKDQVPSHVIDKAPLLICLTTTPYSFSTVKKMPHSKH